MLRHAAMLWRLLGLLLLPSLHSAMHVPNGNNSVRPLLRMLDPADMNMTDWDFGTPHLTMPNMTYMPKDTVNSPSMPDPTICSILMSMPDISLDQIPPSCLCSHCKGITGPKGDQGDRGLPGTPGSPGVRGRTGFSGPRGFTGRQGIKGQKGDLGEKGHSGGTGLPGMKGSRGYKGDKGDFGSEGPPGPLGPQGEDGICPASCESVPGLPGLQGSSGPAGARGLPGVPGPMGQKGMKGPKGDLGTPGNPGMDGLKGDQGEKGMCNCTDGINGTNGLPGDQGFNGKKGDDGAQGDKGSMGLRGNKGDLGVRGVPGPCSTPIKSAFSAALQSSFPASNWPIPFTRVILNLQGHFNPEMGMYTAPVNGTFVFSFNLFIAGKPVIVGLYKNFERMAMATQVNNLSSATMTVVLHLMVGNKVWLQVKDEDFNGVIAGDDYISIFSGFLLYPDSCAMMSVRQGPGFPDELKGEYTWNSSSQTTTPQP